MASLATPHHSHGGGVGITGKRRRRPFYPGERAKLTAWGKKWGQINSEIGKRLRDEGR